MDYALTLLMPILGGLLLGVWLTSQFGVSPIWTIVLAILGMVGGIGIMYKRYAHPELYGGEPFKPLKLKKSEDKPTTGAEYREVYKVLDKPFGKEDDWEDDEDE